MDSALYNIWGSSTWEQSSGSLTYRSGDTEPSIGVELSVDAAALDISGARMQAILTFVSALTKDVGVTSAFLYVETDARFVVGQSVLIGGERILINSVEDTEDSLVMKLTVSRAQSGTTAKKHLSGYEVRTVVWSRTCQFFTDGRDGKFYYYLQQGDIDQAGQYELDFFVERAYGRKSSFTTPYPRIIVNVYGDTGEA